VSESRAKRERIESESRANRERLESDYRANTERIESESDRERIYSEQAVRR
jgi:hypothetical protein